MKSVTFLLAVFITAPMPVTQADTTPNSKNAALFKQACQMGSEDAKRGNVMYSSGISLKNASGNYLDLETRIRKEYEKCYREYISIVANTPVSSIESNHSDINSSTSTKEQSTMKIVDSGDNSKNQFDSQEVKLPPYNSVTPFAWFHDWIAVVEDVPERYAAEKKRAADLKNEFITSCQKVYSVGQNDDALIKHWCVVTGWKDFALKRSALRDDSFEKQLEQMKQQIGLSEESYKKFADRDVKNAFDRTKGVSLNYKMENIEETKVLPYLHGISVALANIKATKIAMKSLDPQLVAERKRDYLAELEMIEKKRIEEEKKQLQRKKHERYLKQKSEADNLTEVACKRGKEDALNLKKLQPDQYKSQAEKLDTIDGLVELIAARYTDCYDTKLLSLTCIKAGDDYMKCVDDGPPEKFMSLSSKNKTVDALKEQYKKCQKERKDLYVRTKIEKEKTHKKLVMYSEIYRERGGYFINDYNECVASLISATNKIPDKLQFIGLSDNDVRSCENISSVLEKYASQSCSCKYGVVVDTLNKNQFTEFSDDILTLIKLSHSDIENNHISKSDGKKFKDSLVYPDEAVEILKKITSECAM